jgi:Golgi phosphoprotein 3 (GPP34)
MVRFVATLTESERLVLLVSRSAMYQGPLADELFLIGHDQYTGKARVGDSVLDTGLAGAILGELALANRIFVDEDTHVTVSDQRSSGDRVTDTALREMLKQRVVHPVRAWVEYLRDSARELIAPRLLNSGLLEEVSSRGMLKQVVRYPARDRINAMTPEVRLRYMIGHPAELDEQTAVLGGLVWAAGLDFVLGGATGREVREGLEQMGTLLKPNLRGLLVGVDAAIAQLSLRGRR